jgi:mRNA-degrading endonuclease YafQ of YafQ-DinJ toxin-antitoxin module
MKIYYSSKFRREYKKLSPALKLVAETKEEIFRKDPYDPRLKTHQLTGSLKGFCAFSIDSKTRIIFEFKSKPVVWFHSAGSHDIYKR